MQAAPRTWEAHGVTPSQGLRRARGPDTECGPRALHRRTPQDRPRSSALFSATRLVATGCSGDRKRMEWASTCSFRSRLGWDRNRNRAWTGSRWKVTTGETSSAAGAARQLGPGPWRPRTRGPRAGAEGRGRCREAGGCRPASAQGALGFWLRDGRGPQPVCSQPDCPLSLFSCIDFSHKQHTLARRDIF